MDDGITFHDDEHAGPPVPPPPPRGPRPRVHPLTLAAVAVAGVAIGVAAVLISDAGQGITAAGTTPSAAPASRPAQGGGLASLPPLTGNSGGLQMMIEGRVTAVSSTSITLGGAGPSVSARITRSTQFSGKVHAVSGVKVGDQVRATLSGSSATSLTATSIEDPGTAQ